MTKLLSHICMILSLVMLAFLVLDQFNPTLFGKTFFHAVLLIYGVAVVILTFIIITRKKKKKSSSVEQTANVHSRTFSGR